MSTRVKWTSECIFCGSRPVTEEHIYSREWIKRLAPGGWTTVATQPRGQELVSHTFPTHGPDVIAKCVCAGCNSGWMNVLDQSAQRVMEPLLTSLSPRLLGLEDQRILATWATKMAMMLDHSAPRPIGSVQPSAHKRLFEDRLPPNEAFVWIAAGAQTRPVLHGAVGGMEGALPAPGGIELVGQKPYEDLLGATFRIGHAVYEVFIPDPRSGFFPVRGDAGWHDYLIQLWPLTFKPVGWPPSKILGSDQEMANMHHSYYK